jgi:hypothetical protein
VSRQPLDDAFDHRYRNDHGWADRYVPKPWTPEELERRERVEDDLRTAEWTFAKTMPENPHWYTARRTWADQRRFTDAVAFIRDHGYVGWWPPFQVPWRAPYLNYDFEDAEGREWFCWTMGWPPAETQVINRKPHVASS